MHYIRPQTVAGWWVEGVTNCLSYLHQSSKSRQYHDRDLDSDPLGFCFLKTEHGNSFIVTGFTQVSILFYPKFEMCSASLPVQSCDILQNWVNQCQQRITMSEECTKQWLPYWICLNPSLEVNQKDCVGSESTSASRTTKHEQNWSLGSTQGDPSLDSIDHCK